MHYNEDAHSKLVTDKSVDLDHSVKIVPDDYALIHFNEGAFNSRVSSDNNVSTSSNVFTLTSDGAIP